MEHSEKLHIINHPLAKHKLTVLRDKNTGVKDFRECMSELSTLIGYKVTEDLPLKEIEVETPFGTTTGKVIDGKTLAFVPILRSGLGMLDGVLSLVPSARVGHIGVYRDPQTMESIEYFCKMPSDIAQREVIILDPLIATGAADVATIQTIKNYSCKNIKLMSILISQEGFEKIHSEHPDVDIYCAAVDEKVTADGYLFPGVGDAGDRLYGTK